MLRHDGGADTTYYYVKDLPGNVTGLVKRTATGIAVANQYDYTPFGESVTGSSTVPNRLQYAAREYDGETQLYYNRARYYDAAVGRFISEDPLGLSAGINLYTYVGNDPVNGRDPSGLCGGSGDLEMWSPKSYLNQRGGGCGNGEHLAALLGLDLVDSRLVGAGGLYAAVDAWFMANYGFGLATALNGTSGDCTFSGNGSIKCSAGSTYCDISTDNPHLSTHQPGNVNVVGKTRCSQTVAGLTVETRLQVKTKCFLFFCSWSTVAEGSFGDSFASYASTSAAGLCMSGRSYRGETVHGVTWTSGMTVFAVTRTKGFSLCVPNHARERIGLRRLSPAGFSRRGGTFRFPLIQM